LESIQVSVPAARTWQAVGLACPRANRFLAIGAARPVPVEVFDAFRELGHQMWLAEDACAAHAQLTHQAHHDDLTALPTRTPFLARLGAALDADARADTCRTTLLVIDLDDFKQVNEVYGHHGGDEMLIEIAARLTEFGGPASVPARFGGDEFGLLLTDMSDPAEVDRIAEQVCQRLLEPIHLSAATVSIGVSIGVANSMPAQTAGDLLRCADIAMYAAKARGRNRIERFVADRHNDIVQHRLFEEHLGQAVGRDEIVVHYQPYVDLRTGRCVGVEALARWQHPTLGLLVPSEFMPMAERTGSINALGGYVLRTACLQMAAWSELPGGQELRIGVNVSARQLRDRTFVATVADALGESGLSAHRLSLELLEGDQMDDKTIHLQLRKTAATGVRIAIDDFGTGTGTASLGELRSFPIHQLKIDPIFLERGDEMLQLVSSVGEILDMETLCKGVETAEQAARLRGTKVTYGQGFFFARPMAARLFPAWLAENALLVAAA
jgi:diguanylate cyclase (GGDEF)-like protein